MRKLTGIGSCLFVLLLSATVAPPALAQAFPGASLRVNLPFEQVDILDDAKFKIRVPANWNGTLLLYIQANKSGAAPAEPRLVPPVLPTSEPPLEDTMLARGYALAASEISIGDWQVKAAVQDTLALTEYFRGRIGDPKRILIWGSSLGGFDAVRLMEEHPRAFDGALATCPPVAGLANRLDLLLGYSLAYDVVFGWQADAWGPLENPKSGLNFATDVAPKANWPKPDGSNRGGWEFIRLVTGWSPEAFWNTDPLYGNTGFLLNMAFATWDRGKAYEWAGGPAAQNVGHIYTLTSDEKKYLAGFGVSADDLLSKMNARANIAASPRARAYVQRYGDLYGTLTKPVLLMHTTKDSVSDARHESVYRQTVEASRALDNLVQVYVNAVGHNALNAKQLLAGLAALESWIETRRAPTAAAFPESLGFDNTFVPPPWPF